MLNRLFALLLLSSLICVPFLKASPITGQAFTATSSDGQNFSGTIGSGDEIQWSGVINDTAGWLYIDLDPSAQTEIFAREWGYVLSPITINVVLTNLTTDDFAGINHLYHNSGQGSSALTAQKNTLSFSFYGGFNSSYGFPYTDWWGYSLETVPNAISDQGGGSSVPDSGMTLSLLGFTFATLVSLRRKFGQG